MIEEWLNRTYSPPPDTQRIGIGGFVAFVRVRESYEHRAEVPDVAVESGASIGDHIIVKPVTIKISGNVSDIHRLPSPILAAINEAGAAIGQVTVLASSVLTTSQTAKLSALTNDVADQIRRVDAAIEAGEDLIEYFGDLDTEDASNQSDFLDFMDGLREAPRLIQITMPFRVLDNMAVTLFTSNTDNQTDAIDFNLEAKQITLAELAYVEARRRSTALDGQLDAVVDKGAQAGVEKPASLLSWILD